MSFAPIDHAAQRVTLRWCVYYLGKLWAAFDMAEPAHAECKRKRREKKSDAEHWTVIDGWTGERVFAFKE